MNILSDAAEKPIAAHLAHFVSRLRFDDIPAETIDAAKKLVLDQLACQLVGSTMPWMKPASDLVRLSAGATGESSVVGGDFACLAADAAFVNASYGQACELDDATYGSAGHIGTATVPVALAVGEREGIDGRTFLVAVVAGYEVMYRLMAAVRPHHRTRGFHSQSIGGPFAGAAAAGKILGLDAEPMTHALAIAGSHSCGTLEYDQSGGEVKRIHAGIAARGGVHSALLASFGLTGPSSIIEGKRGFCNVFTDASDVSKIPLDLGKTFNTSNAWFKMYPVVGGIQTTISALSRLVRENDLVPEDLAKIRVGLTQSQLMHCAAIAQPRDVLGAQFSLAFSAALAVIKRNNDLPQYMNAANWDDPQIVRLMQKVEAYPDPDAVGQKDFMSTVTVTCTDGRSFEAVETYPLGSPRNPASIDDLIAKARGLAKNVLGPEQCETLIRTVQNLERLESVAALAHLLGRTKNLHSIVNGAAAATTGG